MIETNFLARTLEHMLRTIATTQKQLHLRLAQVCMSKRDCTFNVDMVMTQSNKGIQVNELS